MNNRQVAHLWANKSKPQATGSHFYFNGDTIYSYGSHFPIARHYKDSVLFTTKGYSNTTAKHKHLALSSCIHLPIFHVENVMEKPCRADVANYREGIKEAGMKIARARDPQWLLSSLTSLIDEANLFCQTFKFKSRFSLPNESQLAEWREKSKVAAAKKAKATAARNARIEKENETAIQEWLEFKRNALPWNISKVFLRCGTVVSTGAQEMQTSKGAIVPLHEAEKAFRFAMLKRSTGWKRNGETFRIGDFQLDAINDFGVIAGCHRVKWNEIERFAKSQGWIQ